MTTTGSNFLQALYSHVNVAVSSLSNDPELCNHLFTRLLSFMNNKHESPFMYSPLQSVNHIRLLKLLLGSLENELRCELQQFDITAGLNYVYLLYAWGPSAARLPLRCGNKSIWITYNLYSALLRLRDEREHLWAWADTVCIDQAQGSAALTERAAQVRIMDKIYSTASLVVVDLGGASLEMIDRLREAFRDFGKDIVRTFQRARNNHTMVPNASKYTIQHTIWKDYGDISVRPWFTRVWVMQEFVLAKEVVMKIGSWDISPIFLFENLMKMNLHLRSVIDLTDTSIGSQLLSVVNVSNYGFALLCSMRDQRYAKGKKLGLNILLSNNGMLNATDERDYVYAVLGLAKGMKPTEFLVDYSESKARLATRLAGLLIQQGHGIFSLDRAAGIDVDQPSWTPCLKIDKLTRAMGLEMSLVPPYSKYFRACGDTQLHIFHVTSNTMAIQAVMVDFVYKLPNPLPDWTAIWPDIFRTDKGSTREDYSGYESWYKDHYKFAETEFSDWPHAKMMDAFWRTTIADYHSGQPSGKAGRAGQTEQAHFEEFHRIYGYPSTLSPSPPLPVSTVQVNSFGTQTPRCYRRKLCRTAGNRMALVPETTKVGDEVWIFLGVPIPYILRRVGSDQHLVIGKCYVHEMMDGQALNLAGWKPEKVILQ